MAGKTGEILSHNLFAYCGNNPVNAIDEDGNMFGWIRNAWNATKRAVVTGVRKVVSAVKRVGSAVVSGVKRFVRSASNYVRNVYRGFTNTARRTYQRARRWVNNTGRSISRSVQNGAHRVIRQVRNIAQDKEKMEMIRNIVGIASIAAIAIPVVPAIAVTVLGVIELGLDLAAGDNKSAAINLLCLFPMGKGIKMVTGIGGDGLKGAREGKNLYKIATKGPLEMNLQLFGNVTKKIINGFDTTVHAGKQGKHIVGHNNYVKGKSIMNGTIDDIQKLIDDFAGTGQWKTANKEMVDFGKIIGKYVDINTGEVLDTTRGIIHYSQNGVHIVPSKPIP